MLVQELILARERARIEEEQLLKTAQEHRDEAMKLKRRVMAAPCVSVCSLCCFVVSHVWIVRAKCTYMHTCTESSLSLRCRRTI